MTESPHDSAWHIGCLALPRTENSVGALTGLATTDFSPSRLVSRRKAVRASVFLRGQGTRRVRGRAWQCLQNTPPRP
jgi:hypothetical protein